MKKLRLGGVDAIRCSIWSRFDPVSGPFLISDACGNYRVLPDSPLVNPIPKYVPKLVEVDEFFHRGPFSARGFPASPNYGVSIRFL